jgi:hypothetical protein
LKRSSLDAGVVYVGDTASDRDAAIEAGVRSDLLDGLFKRMSDNASTGRLIGVERLGQLENLGLDTEQRDATAGKYSGSTEHSQCQFIFITTLIINQLE